jgi:vacuolar-type H+-ATPase subunit H
MDRKEKLLTEAGLLADKKKEEILAEAKVQSDKIISNAESKAKTLESELEQSFVN